MIKDSFTDEMVKNGLDINIVKMPDKYSDYEDIEKIKKVYGCLRDSFENRPKSFEFDFIQEEEFVSVVNKIVDNTFGYSKKISEIQDNIKKEMMFDSKPHFEEVFNNPEYFHKEKEGLKATVIYISPYDYIDAVHFVHQDHKASDDKLSRLKEAYDLGIKVPMPYLAYGERDEDSYRFGQEGFNRAITATMIGKCSIPVSVRYRENDKNIPDFIKKAIKISERMHNLNEECINMSEKQSRRLLTVSDVNIGVEINDNFNQWNNVKTNDEYENWKKATANFSSGTYGQYNLLDSIKNLENNYKIYNSDFTDKPKNYHDIEYRKEVKRVVEESINTNFKEIIGLEQNNKNRMDYK
jgi:hypothetical protein